MKWLVEVIVDKQHYFLEIYSESYAMVRSLALKKIKQMYNGEEKYADIVAIKPTLHCEKGGL